MYLGYLVSWLVVVGYCLLLIFWPTTWVTGIKTIILLLPIFYYFSLFSTTLLLHYFYLVAGRSGPCCNNTLILGYLLWRVSSHLLFMSFMSSVYSMQLFIGRGV
ncbi:hypothetical protein F5Y11DRAFT_328606 [Daldinia sp. FL1419]|nr:hypothetical protein F5Y11DRAFT_328606 [Daldinia sp. FL1419]